MLACVLAEPDAKLVIAGGVLGLGPCTGGLDALLVGAEGDVLHDLALLLA